MKLIYALVCLLAPMAAPAAQAQSQPPVQKFVPRPLSWEGKATIYDGNKTIDIYVRTRIDASGNIVSESWPAGQGKQAIRRMIINTGGGWVECGGKREPMSKEMLEYERQQFGFSTQLQKVWARREALRPLLLSSQTIIEGSPPKIKRYDIWHPLFAPKMVVEGPVTTTFVFDQSLNPIEAHNAVSSPWPHGEPINQTFYLKGQIVSGGLHWPQEVRIHQEGKPYFTLIIEKLIIGKQP